MPDFSSFEERKIAQSTKIYDRTGEVLLYDINRDIKRTVVQFDNISAYAKDAAVAIEDAEFYSHKGVRPLAIARAIFVNILHLGFSQGGSTITQQVVKNTLLTQEKTVSRKLKEWVLAIKLEQMMSKDEILALYLNEAPYGGSIYGIGEASREFLKNPGYHFACGIRIPCGSSSGADFLFAVWQQQGQIGRKKGPCSKKNVGAKAHHGWGIFLGA